MIRLDVQQGGAEWVRARLGIPTASQFDRIVTPKTLQVSSASVSYRNELLAERFLGEPVSNAGTGYVERGTEMEAAAIGWYEMQQDVDVDRVGFCLTDDRQVGCSPDGFVGEAGAVEIKCPSATVHVGYLCDPIRLVDAYRHQVQGCLWVTGRAWVDIVSYHPTLPAVVQRVERDGAYLAALDEALPLFVEQLEGTFVLLTARHPDLPVRTEPTTTEAMP